MLRGWGAVAGSWFALFAGPQELQFILTNLVADVAGDTAWVTLDENLLSGPTSGTVAAVNVFVRNGDDGWRMVVHHASGVSPIGAGADGSPELDH